MKICPNTSPLLVLARLDRLDLVGEPSRVVLTSAVLAEVHDKLDAISARIDRFGSQCTIVDPAPVGSIDVLRSLGPGEKSVLSWALSVGSDVLCVFDDAAARAEARRLGLGVTGTLGLVLRAKADGRLDEAAPLLRRAALPASTSTMRSWLTRLHAWGSSGHEGGRPQALTVGARGGRPWS